jgi:hypothetical protein
MLSVVNIAMLNVAKTFSITSNGTYRQHDKIKQVVLNKSCLLLKMQKYNTQTLQQFAEIINMKIIYKSN